MAQTGYTPLLIYSSSTVSQAPLAGNLTNSTLGSELAINITDGKLFYKDNANAVQVIAWKTTPTTAGGTGLTSYTAGDLLYYATGTTLSKLAIGASGYWLGSSGTAPQWNAPAALTKTDDTNVTLTLGGSANTALLNAASLTLGWTGQLAVTRGGTGLSTVAQGDILYASASNTLAALAKNTTATRYLSNTGSSNNPAWAQVDLSNGVTGTLPVANGGTAKTSFTSGQVLYGSLSQSANLFTDGTSLAVGSGTLTGRFYVNGADTVSVGDRATAAIVLNNLNGTSNSRINAILLGGEQGNTNSASYIAFKYTTGSGNGYGDLIFGTRSVTTDTAPTERFKITSAGNIVALGVYNATVGATNRDVYVDDGGLIGYVSSLRNSKTNIQNLTDVNWLYQLNTISFLYRKKDQDGNYTDETDGDIQYGMIAEDVEPIKPDLCFYDKTDQGLELRGIQYSKLIVPLLKAIQQLKTELNQVKTQLAAMESK